MNEKNFEYLKDQIKFTGFGQDLEAALKENLAKAQNEFRLSHTAQHGKDELNSSLHFKKSAQSDMYFFNSYDAALKKENAEQAIKQTFYINRQAGNITQKEAYNLLDGRAVNKDLISKEGTLYNAWVQLDFKDTAQNGNHKFKQFSEKYGFDLEKSVAKLSIKELSDVNEKTRVLESLNKGNRQAVTLQQNGNEQRVFVEASPQFKTVSVYDQNNRRLTIDGPRQSERQGASQKQNEKKDAKQQQKEDSDQTAPKTRKGKKVSV
jgi:hypothetical protein